MLSKFSVKKPYTVMVGIILVLILGVVSFSNMTADLLPDINLPYAMVMTTYGGASPEEVETVVSKPVEQAMATVSNIENIQSVSSENMSLVILEFSQSTNMDSVSLEMREKLDQIRSFWDDSVGNPIIMKLNPDMMPVMVAAVEQEGLDSVGITNLVEDEILSELESLEGVASVSASGEVEESVQVVIRQEKIDSVNNKIADALGVTFADARKEMTDAEDELNDAQAKLDSGKAELENGKNTMASQLSGAKSQLESKQMDVLKTEVDLENKLAQIEEGEKELAASEAELLEQEKLLIQAEQAKVELPKKLAELEKQKAQVEAGITGLQALLQLQVQTKTAEELLAQMEAAGTASPEEIAAQKQIVTELQQQKAVMEQQLSSQLDALGISSYTEEAVKASMAQLESNLALIEGGISEVEAARQKIPDDQTIAEGKTQIAAGKEQIAAGKAQMAGAKEQINSAKEQIASGKTTMEEALAMLNQQEISATIEMASAEAQLSAGQTKLDEGKEQLKEGKKKLEDSQDEALENAKLDDKVTPEMISQILTAQNFSMPAGYVTEEGIQYLVRVGDKFSNTEEMENLVLFDMGLEDLEPIKLSDVADVAVTDNSSEVYARINGGPGVLLTMQKQTGYSTGEVSDRIKGKFDDLMEKHEGLHVTALMDQGIYIDLVVDSVLNNLISGAVLAVLILFLFLKDIRPTVVVAFSIPISVIGAVMLMYFSGISLNIISLSGLALGVGMLVDNSIVVIENIYRLRNLGVPIRKAAVQGARQVAGAITASTLTTVCVFLPIVFTKGITRQLFVDMGLTIGYSLLASLVIALTLVPAMSTGLLKKHKETRHPLLRKMTSGYEKIMEKVLRRKAPVLIAMMVLLVVSGVLAAGRGTAFIPAMESTQTMVSLKMPEGSSVEETGAMADEVMKRLEDLKDIEEMGAMAGNANAMMGMGGGSAGEEASIYLILSEKKEMTGSQLTDEIIKRTEDLECEITVSTNNMDMSALGGSGIQVQIKGKELDTLQKIAADVAGILEDTKGLEQVSDGMEETTEELRLVVDKAAASEHNLTVAQIFQQVQTQLKERGAATTLSTESKDYEVIVSDEKQTAYTRDDVKDFTIEATDTEGNTEEIPLEELAEFVPAEGPDAIQRSDQSRYLTVSAVVSEGYNVGLLGNKVEKKLADYQVPEGYSVEMAGEDEMIQESMIEVLKMLALAVVFIYLIMVAQFQSLLSPFIVMFTMPLAFTGGFLGLWLTGQEVSIIAMIGFVMLSGIIVNNGIVLVDYINQLRAEGMEKRKAIIQAGKTRMRPILMTALTTILGLSTMGLGVGMGADMIQPMAVVTIGGLLYGTVLTLFVVPCIYDILNRKEYYSDKEEELDDTDYIPETVEKEEEEEEEEEEGEKR
ncbi:MAG: efflux RND transporter permease subunit [Clostridiales bacterium]|nr:efflux RND transporter permease subunit [Clostridiales bacterium]